MLFIPLISFTGAFEPDFMDVLSQLQKGSGKSVLHNALRKVFQGFAVEEKVCLEL